MGLLIVLLILIPVLLLILLFNSINTKLSENRETLKDVKENLDQLSGQLQELQIQLHKKDKPEEKAFAVKSEPAPEVKPETTVFVTTPVIEIEEKIIVYQTSIPEEEVDERKLSEDIKPKSRADLERFIGENLANKIGIAVLVLGISFFVKYAIDKNWINETGRVIIGLVSGGILIGVAHYIRNNYRSFSSVLIGGGLTVFYFTIAFAFHQYGLISQQAAFISMVVISAFAVLLSLYYKRQELAILATIGGFITPFLVTTGQENYIALFTYLCILNAGLMVLAWFKRWPAINIIALFFTTIIYGGWLIKRTIFNDPGTLPYKDALIFATIFYVQFVVMNIINNLRMKRKFSAFDFLVVFTTNFLYYISALFILANYKEDYKGFFTLSLGIFNFLLVAFFYRRNSIDRNFISLLIGFSLTFISLTPLVQFRGEHVALFWAGETVVLYWLYQRSRITHLKIASLIISVLMLVSLFYTWFLVYFLGEQTIPVIINRGFITTVAVSIALFIYYLLVNREQEKYYLNTLSNKVVKDSALTATIIIAYLAGAWEICYQFNTRFTEPGLYAMYLQAYSFATVILILFTRKRTEQFPFLKILLTALSFVLYLVHLPVNYEISLVLLNSNNSMLFVTHWIAAVFLFWLLYDLTRFFFTQNGERWLANRSFFTWIATASIVLLLSVEMYHVILWTSFRNENDWIWWENLYYKAGLTILWSICSFTMMWLGMKSGFRTLRVISLSLFTLTLVKLFSYDIRNIPPGGKIAAFILLGILLLTVSFMYQRLKRIIIDDAGK